MKSMLLLLIFLLMPCLCFGASNCGENENIFWKKELKLQDGGKMNVELSCINNCYQADLELGDGSVTGTASTCNEELDKGWNIHICGLVLDKFDGTLSDVANKAKSLCEFNQRKAGSGSQKAGNQPSDPSTENSGIKYYPIKQQPQNIGPKDETRSSTAGYQRTEPTAALVDRLTDQGSGQDSAPNMNEIGLLAGSNAGTYIKIARDIQQITRNIVHLRVDMGGSLGNINRLLTDRRAQFAIVQYDALLYKKAFEDPQLENKISIIMPLYNEEIHLIVNRQAGINSLADLNGKRVNTDKLSSGCWVTATIIKEKMNLNWQEHYLPPVEAIKAVISGELDAFFYVCGQPAPILKALGEDASEFIKLVPMEVDSVYPSTVINAETYPWLKENIRTNMTPALLVTWNYWEGARTKRFNDYVAGIRKIVSTIVEHIDYLKTYKHPKWKEVNPFDYGALKWPIHEASLEVLKKNRTVSDHEKKKQKLFELLKKFM